MTYSDRPLAQGADVRRFTPGRAGTLVTLTLLLLAPVLLTDSAPAQLQDGDIVLAVQDTVSNPPGLLLRLDPVTGVWSTLAVAPTAHPYTFVRMASNNRDLLVPADRAVFRIAPDGLLTTVALSEAFHPRGMDLDHDQQWLLASYTNLGSSLWSLDDATGLLSTLFGPLATGWDTDLAIDRDPGAPPYVIASSPEHLFTADRQGRLTTLVHLPWWDVLGVELDLATGDYLTLARGAPAVAKVSRTGAVTTLTHSIPSPYCARYDATGQVWVASNTQPARICRLDRHGVINTVHVLNGISLPARQVVGIEIYGSRRLVCRGSGRPGTTVQVALQSARPGDGGQSYALAASLGRRPGIPLPHGEPLHLTPDPLFYLTALDQAPHLFRGFRGVTDASGRANAEVQIPAALPRGLRVTVFVAGVIFGSTGPRTTTGSHWFVID